MTTDKDKRELLKEKLKKDLAAMTGARLAQCPVDAAREQGENETDAEYEKYLLDNLTETKVTYLTKGGITEI